jgi:hypothetical protein
MPAGLSPEALAQLALAVFAGFASWGFIEYVIHGLLSHRFKTFVTPLHWGHHIDNSRSAPLSSRG